MNNLTHWIVTIPFHLVGKERFLEFKKIIQGLTFSKCRSWYINTDGAINHSWFN